MKMGIKDRDNCFFFYCDSKPETIEHLFWYCDQIFPLWSALANWIWSETEIEIEFSLESVLLGYTNCLPCKNDPDFAGAQSYLKFHFDYNVEKFVHDFSHQGKILSKWKPMVKLFCQ